MKTETRVHIRWLIRRDLAEVLAIENASFETPWTEDDFLNCLRQRNAIGMVAESVPGEHIIGFMVYELHKLKLHILNFAVQPGQRRAGVGTQMLGKLTDKLATHRRTKLTVNVRERNLGAQLFFHSQSMNAVNVMQRYYEDTDEDAYRFVYRLPAVEESIKKVPLFYELGGES